MNPLRQVYKHALRLFLRSDRYRLKVRAGVALTFDDGPDPEVTPRLLDVLAAHDIPATFFVIGEKAEANPLIVRRIIREGHAIGNHTWSHSEPATTSAPELLTEIRRTRKLIADITGVDTRLMRPPKGELNTAKMRALITEGESIVLWSADPKDWLMDSAEELRHWAEEWTPERGDIVLLHDRLPHCIDGVTHIARAAAEFDLPLVRIEQPSELSPKSTEVSRV